MTLEQLVSYLGTAFDDNVVPYLWSNEEFTEYLNESIEEWCRVTDANIDSDTEAVCEIAIVAGTGSYDLHEKILKIVHAYIEGEDNFLEKQHTDYIFALWGTQCLTERDTPTYYTLDYTQGKISLWPIPESSGTLHLMVSRLPLVELEYVTPNPPGTPGTDAEPDIPPRYHRDMLAGVRYRAFLKNDADTESLARAKVALAEWNKVLDKSILEHGLYQYRPRAIMPEYGFI